LRKIKARQKKRENVTDPGKEASGFTEASPEEAPWTSSKSKWRTALLNASEKKESERKTQPQSLNGKMNRTIDYPGVRGGERGRSL